MNESNYEFGKMSGQSKNFSKSGIEAIVYYEDDTMQKREMYYTNGKLKSMENFKSGKSHGTNTEYFENGNIREIEYTDHGNRIRLIIYDKSGKVTLDEHY
jgi:antitoxin component YwqK of YwqJK toxin-antitoxin module